MAARKPDSEVGPIGVWAYGVRKDLKLTPEAVAAALPSRPDHSTIRKIESNPRYHPPKMVRELYEYYRTVGERAGVYVAQPPQTDAATGGPDQTAVVAAMDRQTEAIHAQTAAIEAQTEMLAAVLSRLAPAPVGASEQSAMEQWARGAVERIEELAAPHRPEPELRAGPPQPAAKRSRRPTPAPAR